MLSLTSDIKLFKGKFDYNKEYYPEPGMLGTMHVGSDRYGVICVSVDSPKRITVANFDEISDKDEAKDNPNIDIDENGVMRYLKLEEFVKKLHKNDFEKWSLRTKANGKQYWKEMGKDFSGTIYWGIADPYRDPDF